MPLYEQLYRAIKADILAGALRGGEKLPSKRVLAEQLSVSKITVETAYGQLLAEGYVTARQRAGYFVEALSLPQPGAAAPIPAEPPLAETRTEARPAALFPFSVWARLMRSVLLDAPQALLAPGPNLGLPELRQSVAGELLRQRGMTVGADQIVIGAGAEYFYALLTQFLGRDKRYALENPGHRKLGKVYENCGAQVCPLPMDQDGVRPEALEASGAQILHISPSHHYPTGIVMPISRRQALLRWLEGDGERYLIEDDYDAEFRFSGLPIPPMQTMDTTGRLIYLNTFSKTLTPALRISYMVLPRALLGRWQAVMGFYSCAVPSFEQMTLTRFLAEGYFEKHLNRTKKHYRAIRERLLDMLAQGPCAHLYTVEGSGAGLHFLLRFDPALGQRRLAAALTEAGLEPVFLSSFYRGQPNPADETCMLVPYADLEPEKLESALKRLAFLLTD